MLDDTLCKSPLHGSRRRCPKVTRSLIAPTVRRRSTPKKLAEVLAKEGQLLLPMLSLIENAQTAIDVLIEVMGRATTEAVLLMSGRIELVSISMYYWSYSQYRPFFYRDVVVLGRFRGQSGHPRT